MWFMLIWRINFKCRSRAITSSFFFDPLTLEEGERIVAIRGFVSSSVRLGRMLQTVSSLTLDMLVIEDTGALCQSSSPTKVLIPGLMRIRCHSSLNRGVMQNWSIQSVYMYFEFHVHNVRFYLSVLCQWSLPSLEEIIIMYTVFICFLKSSY